MTKPRVLFCTAAGGEYGFGHLKRCLSIIEEARGLFEGQILLCRGSDGGVISHKSLDPHLSFLYTWEEVGEVDLIVSDQRDTSVQEMTLYSKKAPVIALDDLGAGQLHAHCTVFSLPTTREVRGNYTGLRYLVLDPGFRNGVRADETATHVVVTFGGSDPDDLTGLAVGSLNRLGVRPLVVRGPLFTHGRPKGDYELVDNPRDMAGVLARAGVVITSFGMTLFEALCLGTPVVLLNHSPYHDELSRTFPGIANLGYYADLSDEELDRRLGRVLSEPERLRRVAAELSGLVDARGAERIVSTAMKVLQGGRSHCFFHHGTYTALRREEAFSLMACKKCRDLFLCELESLGDIYGGDYFLSEYESQYGKSYALDRENIEGFARRRLAIIERCFRGGVWRRQTRDENRARSPGRILDVGCALGFFLGVARERGWVGTGIEVSDYAARWARDNLGVEVLTGSFLNAVVEPEGFDAIAFFFVAEHLKDVEKVIERAHTLLKRGGVLACALPNRGGISYCMNRGRYVEEHPRDHYFDTAPRNLIRFLRRYGFRKRRIRTTGIHPERFFQRVGLGSGVPLLDSFYTGIARALRLGDTFEYYGIKT